MTYDILVRMCYRKVLLAAMLLMLVFVPGNPNYHKGIPKEEDENWKNVPWVHNSIAYTKRIHQPDLRDLSRRSSFSYDSDLISEESLNVSSLIWQDVRDPKSIDDKMDNFFDKLYHNNYMEDVQIVSTVVPFEQGDEAAPFHLKQQLDVIPEMNDIFGDLEKYGDKTVFRKYALNRYQPQQIRDRTGNVKWKHKLSQSAQYQSKMQGTKSYRRKGLNKKKGLIKLIEEFIVKAKVIGQRVLKNINHLIYRHSKRRYVLVNRQLNDPIDRQVVSAHVVTTPIQPWIFPFLYGIAEPYIPFITFLIN